MKRQTLTIHLSFVANEPKDKKLLSDIYEELKIIFENKLTKPKLVSHYISQEIREAPE